MDAFDLETDGVASLREGLCAADHAEVASFFDVAALADRVDYLVPDVELDSSSDRRRDLQRGGVKIGTSSLEPGVVSVVGVNRDRTATKRVGRGQVDLVAGAACVVAGVLERLTDPCVPAQVPVAHCDVVLRDGASLAVLPRGREVIT